MKFWDSSALIPLFVDEANSATMKSIAQEDQSIIVWWGSSLECRSAFARLRRENRLTSAEEDQMIGLLNEMTSIWTEILPGENVRRAAARLLMIHPLRAADAMQLAAAMVWASAAPDDGSFICLDHRLNGAARKEGFRIMPLPERSML